jgi:hypothetical protein
MQLRIEKNVFSSFHSHIISIISLWKLEFFFLMMVSRKEACFKFSTGYDLMTIKCDPSMWQGGIKINVLLRMIHHGTKGRSYKFPLPVWGS